MVTFRHLAITLASLAAVAVLGSSAHGLVASGTAATVAPRSADPAAVSPEIERGRYLAHLGDCAGCHTANGGQPLAGGLALDTGFGAIYTPNITPDRDTGIGNWSKDDFYRALHTGHDDEGKHLYPAFPYPWFTRITRTDADAMKDYLDSVAPVHPRPNRPAQLAWYMRWRASVAGWNLLWFDPGLRGRPEPVGGVEPRRLPRRGPRPLRRLPHAQGLLRRRPPKRGAVRRLHLGRPRQRLVRAQPARRAARRARRLERRPTSRST